MNLLETTSTKKLNNGITNGTPEGWTRCPLEKIALRITKGATPTSYGFMYQGEGIRFVKVENLNNGRIDHKSIKHFISEEANLNQRRSVLLVGDILFSIAGTIGRTCLVREEDLPANTNQALAIIRGTSDILLPYFLQLQLQSQISSRQASNQARGGSMNNISLEDVGNIEIWVPPLTEQKRIVAKLEELLTRVNATKERLAKVAMILKRFRQAVLAAACSGRLTAAWRERQTLLESASVILELLQQQHLRMDNSGFLENDLPEIPENWIWAKVGQLGDVTTGSTPSKKEASYFGGSIPFFKPTDLDAGYNVEKSIDSLTEEGAEIARILPPLAVMVTCIGATIGKTGLGRGAGATNQQINSVVTNHEFVSPYWLFWTFTSPWVQEQIKLHASETTLPILNKGRFEKLSLPLPPLTEQQEIVHRVESMFKLADAVKKRVAAAKVRSDKLTQAILAKAFRGELVPTEAELARREHRSYEPASDLLARIKSDKEINEISVKLHHKLDHKKRSKPR